MDEKTSEVEWPDFKALLKKLFGNHATRYILLAPTALTALGSLTGLGDVARWILSHWLPFVGWIKNYLNTLEVSNYIDGLTLVLIIFMAPFVIEKLLQYKRYSDIELTHPIIALAAFVSYGMIIGGSGILPNELFKLYSHAGDRLVIAITIFGILPFIGAAIITGLGFFPFLLPLPVYALWTFLLLGHSDLFGDAGILSLLLLSLPLINPRRLADVGALMIGIIAISTVADMADKFIGMLKAG